MENIVFTDLPSIEKKTLDYYDFRHGKIPWDDFIKTFEFSTMKTDKVSRNDLAILFANVEIHDQRVACVFLNATTFAEMRNWLLEISNPPDDEEITVENYGLIRYLWGSAICVNPNFPKNKIFIASEEGKGFGALLEIN